VSEYPYGFRSLIVWQKAQELALEVTRLVAVLPNDRVASVLGRQVVASAASVAANIAEGYGRYAAGAYRNHLSIARGSACETDGWLDLLRKSGYIDDETESKLHGLCMEVVKLLTTRMIRLDKQRNGRGRIREGSPPYELELDELAEALQ
jgi:four helix bundle protein